MNTCKELWRWERFYDTNDKQSPQGPTTLWMGSIRLLQVNWSFETICLRLYDLEELWKKWVTGARKHPPMAAAGTAQLVGSPASVLHPPNPYKCLHGQHVSVAMEARVKAINGLSVLFPAKEHCTDMLPKLPFIIIKIKLNTKYSIKNLFWGLQV